MTEPSPLQPDDGLPRGAGRGRSAFRKRHRDGTQFLSAELVGNLTGKPNLWPDLHIAVPMAFHLGYHGPPIPGLLKGFGHVGLGGTLGWADPDTGSAFGFVHNRLLTPMVFDMASFALMAQPMRSAIASARKHGALEMPQLAATCRKPRRRKRPPDSEPLAQRDDVAGRPLDDHRHYVPKPEEVICQALWRSRHAIVSARFGTWSGHSGTRNSFGLSGEIRSHRDTTRVAEGNLNVKSENNRGRIDDRRWTRPGGRRDRRRRGKRRASFPRYLGATVAGG